MIHILPIAFLLVAIIALAGIVHLNHKAIKHMAENQTELAAEIRAANAQIRKGTDEVLGKIKNLEDVIAAGGPISDEVKAALAELTGSAQKLDDVVPDATPA